jgi:hypothetical protein
MLHSMQVYEKAPIQNVGGARRAHSKLHSVHDVLSLPSIMVARSAFVTLPLDQDNTSQ